MVTNPNFVIYLWPWNHLIQESALTSRHSIRIVIKLWAQKSDHDLTTTWKWLCRKSRSFGTRSFSLWCEIWCSMCSPASLCPSVWSPAGLWLTDWPSRVQRSPQTPYLLPGCWWRSRAHSNPPLFAAHRSWWWTGEQPRPQLWQYGSGPGMKWWSKSFDSQHDACCVWNK